MSAETRLGQDQQQYLLANFFPKSDEQLKWEQDIRAVVFPIILAGEHRPLPGGWEDSIERPKQMAAEAETIREHGLPVLRNLAVLMLTPSRGDVALAQKLVVVREKFQALPLYRVVRDAGNSNYVSVQSQHESMEGKIVDILADIYAGSRDVSDPNLLPSFDLDDCELYFSSRLWLGRGRSISPDVEKAYPIPFSKKDYVLTDRGLELPSYVRAQIEVVTGVVARPTT